MYIHSGTDRGRAFPIAEGHLVVGRNRDAGIQLSDPLISGEHLRIARVDDAMSVEDLGSANGTKVDGTPLPAGALRVVPFGTLFEIGDTIAEFVAPGSEPKPATSTLIRSERTGRSLTRRGKAAIAAVAGISVLALAIGIAALTRGPETSSPAPVAAANGETHDPAWVMRTQGHTTVQVFACENATQQSCDDSMQGGTGSVIDLGEGYVLTNFHVIANDDSTDPLPDLATAVSIADEDYVDTEVVGFSACDDLALLRIIGDAGPLDLAEATLGDTDGLEVGDQIVVLGFPGTSATAASGDQQMQLTAGNVSAKQVVVDNYRDLLQISAPINHGNSGGPVFDLDGRQVGVATLGDGSDTQGIFYAISIDRVNEVLPSLIDGSTQSGLESCPE